VAMNWDTIQLPLAAGLNQKADPRALQPPELLRATDVQFDEVGGLQTRYPFVATGVGVDIYGGGTLSNIRRIVPNGNELLCFTDDTLYSWNAQLSKWVSKGTHLAVKVEEQTVFATTGDQINTDAAELDGVIFYSWQEGPSGSEAGFVAAVDKVTGSVLMAPTSTSGFRQRLVALETAVLLAYYDNVAGVYCFALDPAAPALGVPATLSNGGSGAVLGPYFDIVRIPGADQAAFVVSEAADTQYVVGTVTAGLTVARSTKARNSTGPIAISCEPTGTSAQVVRGDTGNIEGDLITLSTLADVYINQAIGTHGTTLNRITAAHRSVQDSGVYRCYVFWSSDEIGGTSSAWATESNWVSTGNTLGTAADFILHVGPASRAFDHDGRVYLWTAFAGSSQSGDSGILFGVALQNGYFLVRDDAFLVAKAAPNGKAGGFPSSAGFVGGVQSTASGYLWCGALRTRVPFGGGSRYANREPARILATFDSNEARRCARIGNTLYITGGEVLQYDGRQLTEVGFHVYPWNLLVAGGSGGSMAGGDYAHKPTYRWVNANGETERSAGILTATTDVNAGGGENAIGVTGVPMLQLTHKATKPVAIEIWRTKVNPIADAQFYLSSSENPVDTGLSSNEYIANVIGTSTISTFGDYLADDSLEAKETNPETGSYLESIAPPAATIIVASADRLFLAGVAGDPDRVWYSKLRNDGEVASFSDALTVAVPREGGAITGLAFLNETLIVFRETAIYALPGDGYDNTGGGANYGPARAISTEVGAQSHESIALEPRGLVFQSSKGKYLLNRGWSVEYIGANVCDYDSEPVLAVQVVETQHQIRWLTASRMLVLDYLVNQWAEWSIASGVHSCVWDSAHHVATATTITRQQTTYTGVDYGLDVEMQIKPSNLQGAARVRSILALGEYRSAHKVRIRAAFDYATTYTDDKLWTVSPTTVGGPEQPELGPSRQRCQAIKVRITACGSDATTSNYTAPTGEALKLTGLGLELGFKPGLHRHIPVAQKAGG
jgi:hypothetical protein